MNKYLIFQSGDYQFAINIAEVLEVFDADAASEPIENVLIGNDFEVYWRGTLALLMPFNDLLECEHASPLRCYPSSCFIVCKNSLVHNSLYILQVDKISCMQTIDAFYLSRFAINNKKLKQITNRIYIAEYSEHKIFLLNELKDIFTSYRTRLADIPVA